MYYDVVRTFCEVRYILDLRKNLISLGTLQVNDFNYKMYGDSDTLRVFKGALTMMKGKRGRVGVQVVENNDEESAGLKNQNGVVKRMNKFIVEKQDV
ncbi:hypothetical protein CR513_28456, partial [Mucuna pruriens]